jgi:hypothetical protein
MEERVHEQPVAESPPRRRQAPGGSPRPVISNRAVARQMAGGERSRSIASDTAARIHAMRGGGAPIAAGPSSAGSPQGARVHTGASADELARQLDARAFTVGKDVFFRSGAYQPHTPSGRALLAHELTHVSQATEAGSAGPVATTAPTDAAEREADRTAAAPSGVPDRRPTETIPAGRIPRQPAPARVTTPPFEPRAPLAADVAPTEDEAMDAEGNKIARSPATGRWYLNQEPASLPFKLAPGYRYQLLPMNPVASFQALKAQCEAIRDDLLATANLMRGDMKYWFTKTYHFVTKNELGAIDSGIYQYPHMKMQEVILFHATYQQNLDAWYKGEQDKVEANWKAAFSEAESYNDGSFIRFRSQEIGNSLLPAFQAHIRFDLPRAISAAYDMHYSGIPGTSIDDFKQDFFNMGPVFDQASEDLAPELGDESYFFDPGGWGWLRDALFPFFFSMGLERQLAWDKAKRISDLRGQGLEAVDNELRAEMNTAHPNLGAMEVAGDEVTGFDWQTQPGLASEPQSPEAVNPPATIPTVPDKLFFKLGLPEGPEPLEDAVRPDQDLQFLLDLAEWTRGVKNAEIYLSGHASAEGTEVMNLSLSSARVDHIKFFLFRAGADLDNNHVYPAALGKEGAKAGPEWRYVRIRVLGHPLRKQQVWGRATSVPGEAPPPEEP